MKETNDIELLKKNNYENKDIYISCNSIFKRKIILDDHIFFFHLFIVLQI